MATHWSDTHNLISTGCLAFVAVNRRIPLFLEREGPDLLTETGHVHNGDLVLVLQLAHNRGDQYDAFVLDLRGGMGWIYADMLHAVAPAPTY